MWNSPQSLFGRDTPQENLLYYFRLHRNDVDCWLLTVDCSLSTVNNELEFTIPMLTDLILFVEQAGKPAAEGRGGHPTIKVTQDVNSKVRSPF